MKPQKALHKYKADEKKTQNYRGHQYLMFPKIDGWYGYKDLGEESPIHSNNERIIPSCLGGSNTLTMLEKKYDLPHGRLIFEITVDGTPQFETMNGILNRKAICPAIRLNVHDFVPKGAPETLTLDRYLRARDIVSFLDMDWIESIDHLGASNVPEEWESKAVQLIDKGIEGLIMKKVDAGYSEGKRNEDLLKIKEECEFDLLCIGYKKGAPDSKYSDTVGALYLQDKKGAKFTVSGMTDGQRNEWWNHPEKIVHKVVKIKAKNVMKDGSLREARFNVIRFDKNMDDIDEVK